MTQVDRKQAPELATGKSKVLRDELVDMTEYGHGLENECPICYAEIGCNCSIPDETQPGLGIELTTKVHKSRQF